MSLGKMPRSGLARPYGKGVFNFIWKLPDSSIVSTPFYIPTSSAGD